MTVEPGVPAFQPSAGQVVGGRYELQQELGRGGMGSVWSARNVSLDAPCAIKFMHSELRGKSELRRRFMREARAAGQLRSPFIVTVFEVGEWNGWPYMAMELLEGETLEKRLEREGKLSPALTLQIVSQIARGLAAAHAAGLVHRDLKPENVFLIRRDRVTEDDELSVKVLDFGVAKHVEATSGVKTAHGALLGTPYYMSPEQVQGDGNIDHRSDVWALGVLTFECLTGRLPFSGNSVGEILIAILQAKIPELGVPGCERFWTRASQRDRELRFQTALELAASLREAIEDDRTLLATPKLQSRPSANAQLAVPKQRIRLWAIAALVICVGIGALFMRASEPPAAPETRPQAALAGSVELQPAAAQAAQPSQRAEPAGPQGLAAAALPQALGVNEAQAQTAAARLPEPRPRAASAKLGEPQPQAESAPQPTAADVAGTGFSLDTQPSGARVFVDGRALDGVTPLRVPSLAAGTHTVRVEKLGFRAHTIAVVLTDGAWLDLPKAVLEPAVVAQDAPPKPRPAAEKQAKPRLGKYDELIGF